MIKAIRYFCTDVCIFFDMIFNHKKWKNDTIFDGEADDENEFKRHMGN